MSIGNATTNRLEFLTSRWEYDIPHKFVWVIDIHSIDVRQILFAIKHYERHTPHDWPIKSEVSPEHIRSSHGFMELAQEVSFPSEGYQVETTNIENRAGWIPGIVGGMRNPYGSENMLNITFLETNIDIIDYFIKPWIIAASHLGFIEREHGNIKATIDAYLYARSINRDNTPTLRKHITFFNCVPNQVDADKVSYDNLSYNDITKPVGFVFQRYKINNIRIPPEIKQTPQIITPTPLSFGLIENAK